jgi:hypothetical protein
LNRRFRETYIILFKLFIKSITVWVVVDTISLIETHVKTPTSNHPGPSAVGDGCLVSDDERTSEDSSDDKLCLPIVCTDKREGVFILELSLFLNQYKHESYVSMS